MIKGVINYLYLTMYIRPICRLLREGSELTFFQV